MLLPHASLFLHAYQPPGERGLLCSGARTNRSISGGIRKWEIDCVAAGKKGLYVIFTQKGFIPIPSSLPFFFFVLANSAAS